MNTNMNTNTQDSVVVSPQLVSKSVPWWAYDYRELWIKPFCIHIIVLYLNHPAYPLSKIVAAIPVNLSFSA
jgi:hypothetical protein